MTEPAGAGVLDGSEDLETLSAMLEDMGPEAAEVAAQVVAQHEAGLLTLPAAVAALSIVVRTAIAQAGIVGGAHATAQLAEAGLRAGNVSAALSTRVEGRNGERLDKAAATALSSENPDASARRLAHSEVASAARAGAEAAMTGSPDGRRIIGWRRQLDSDPCPTCRAWHAGGRLLPVTAKMATHPNCDCTQRWILEGDE